MQGWQREQIIKIYKRKVIAYPEGKVVHIADCGIYNAFLGVCTCGLHHMLWMASEEVREELYPELIEEKCNDGFIEYLLQEFESDNLYVKDKSEFVKVDRPEPISQEEFDKVIDEIFKKKDKDEEE